MSLVNRNNIQKVEAEFSTYLLLFRHGKRDKNAGLVYFDSLSVVISHSNRAKKKKSAIYHSGINTDAFDKSLRIEMGSNRRQKRIP
jgi:hypothetical protein